MSLLFHVHSPLLSSLETNSEKCRLILEEVSMQLVEGVVNLIPIFSHSFCPKQI
jgi:hypothetical protein